MVKIKKQNFKHGIFSYYENDLYIGKSLSEYGEWSEAEVELIKQIVPQNKIIIEIGSNIGTHTIPMAKHLTNGGKVFAFEPQSQNYKLLQENINNNDIKNVKIYNIAISSKKGEAFINKFDEAENNNYGDARIFKDKFKKCEKVTVNTIDELFSKKIKENFSIHLIKCDAQGQELNIILGSEKILDQYKPFIYIENDDIECSKMLIQKIKSLGYLMYWHLPPLFNPNNFLKNSKNIFPNIRSCNMFCFHRSRKIKLDKIWEKFEISNDDFHPFKKKLF